MNRYALGPVASGARCGTRKNESLYSMSPRAALSIRDRPAGRA
jgi:hypothetical protein